MGAEEIFGEGDHVQDVLVEEPETVGVEDSNVFSFGHLEELETEGVDSCLPFCPFIKGWVEEAEKSKWDNQSFVRWPIQYDDCNKHLPAFESPLPAIDSSWDETTILEEDSGLTEVEIHSNSFTLRRSLSEIENAKEHEEIEEEATLEEMNVPLRPGDEEEDDEHKQEVKDKTVIADGHDAFEEAEVEGIIGTFCILV